MEPFTKSREYYSETFSRNTDLINYYQLVKRLIDIYEGRGEATFKIKRDEVLKNVDGYFKDFDSEIDQKYSVHCLRSFPKK